MKKIELVFLLLLLDTADLLNSTLAQAEEIPAGDNNITPANNYTTAQAPQYYTQAQAIYYPQKVYYENYSQNNYLPYIPANQNIAPATQNVFIPASEQSRNNYKPTEVTQDPLTWYAY